MHADPAVEIPLTGGLVAVVDAQDAARILGMGAWQTTRYPHVTYARKSLYRAGRYTSVNMHSVILGVPLVDHVNGDGLDNRRANLRPATVGENALNRSRRSDNTSGYKGVSRNGDNGRWRAYINRDGRRLSLGSFGSAEEAARAYDTAALELHGAFARLNFPEGTR